jgi:transposase-like protein
MTIECGKNKPFLMLRSMFLGPKRRLAKFHGINDSTFYLHLKECEFRFNFRDSDIYKMLLKMFRDEPLF